MVGYFALNVPSGLSLYYFANTVITSGQQIWLRKLGGAALLHAHRRAQGVASSGWPNASCDLGSSMTSTHASCDPNTRFESQVHDAPLLLCD